VKQIGVTALQYGDQRHLLLFHLFYTRASQVNFFVGAFYDGVYLLGMALNETLSEGGDIHNGTAITRRMWNRDFHGEINFPHTIK
jgi:hypothetical protein